MKEKLDIEDLKEFLDSPNPDAGRRCDQCGMRDGHHLIYCYRCPGRYFDIKETWRESIMRFPEDKSWVSNRIDCIEHKFKWKFISIRAHADFESRRAEFDKLVRELCGLEAQ